MLSIQPVQSDVDPPQYYTWVASTIHSGMVDKFLFQSLLDSKGGFAWPWRVLGTDRPCSANELNFLPACLAHAQQKR